MFFHSKSSPFIPYILPNSTPLIIFEKPSNYFSFILNIYKSKRFLVLIVVNFEEEVVSGILVNFVVNFVD